MTSPPSVASDARRELAAAGTCRSQAALCTFARPGRRKTSSPPPGSEAGSARLPSCVRCQTAPVPILHQVPLLHCAALAALATAAAEARPLGAAATTTRHRNLLLRRHSNHYSCRRIGSGGETSRGHRDQSRLSTGSSAAPQSGMIVRVEGRLKPEVHEADIDFCIALRSSLESLVMQRLRPPLRRA